MNLAAQKSHRKIAVTTVAANGLGSQPFRCRNGRVFRFAGRKKIASDFSDFGGWPQNRRKLAVTTAASHRSRLTSRPQRPRDTLVMIH